MLLSEIAGLASAAGSCCETSDIPKTSDETTHSEDEILGASNELLYTPTCLLQTDLRIRAHGLQRLGNRQVALQKAQVAVDITGSNAVVSKPYVGAAATAEKTTLPAHARAGVAAGPTMPNVSAGSLFSGRAQAQLQTLNGSSDVAALTESQADVGLGGMVSSDTQQRARDLHSRDSTQADDGAHKGMQGSQSIGAAANSGAVISIHRRSRAAGEHLHTVALDQARPGASGKTSLQQARPAAGKERAGHGNRPAAAQVLDHALGLADARAEQVGAMVAGVGFEASARRGPPLGEASAAVLDTSQDRKLADEGEEATVALPEKTRAVVLSAEAGGRPAHVPPKNKAVLLVLEMLPFCGPLGIDRIYLGSLKWGLIKLAVCVFTAGWGGVAWGLLDAALVSLNGLKRSSHIDVLGMHARFAAPGIELAHTLSIANIVIQLLFFCAGTRFLVQRRSKA